MFSVFHLVVSEYEILSSIIYFSFFLEQKNQNKTQIKQLEIPPKVYCK